MKEIFLSKKEKKELYNQAREHVTRDRSKVGSLIHGLDMAHTAINLLGKGNCYVFHDPIGAAEQQHVWWEYGWRKRDLIRMKEKGLINIDESKKCITVELMNPGYVQSLRGKIANCFDKFPEDRVCIVSYDIPEHDSNERARFRYLLQSSNFVKLQRSVWISKFNVTELIREYVEEVAMTDWVTICTASIFPKILRSEVFGKSHE